MWIVYNSRMEWASGEAMVGEVRAAGLEDTAVLTQLLKKARYQHYHADWHLPVDWLGKHAFVVWDDGLKGTSVSEKLMGERESVRACLAAAADPMPAAWVRVAALREMDEPTAVLAQMLEKVEAVLRETAVTELGWMPVTDWPEQWLTQLGFCRVNQMQTFVKEGTSLPMMPDHSNIMIRPVTEGDFQKLSLVAEAAFAPLWRHSVAGLIAAKSQTLSFNAAWLDGELVGYEMSTANGRYAHLAHIAIHPSHQGKGVGSQLLAHTIQDYAKNGVQSVSLNTQADNQASQKLYRKFGFKQIEEHYSVWAKSL